MKKGIRILLIIACGTLIILAGIGIYNYVSLRDFYATAEKEFQQPGIEDPKFAQQGFVYDEDHNRFLFTGYMWDFSANPVFIVDPESGKTVKTVYLTNEDGSPFHNHAGGIVVNGDFLYVAGSDDDCIYVFSRPALYASSEGGSIPCLGTFSTKLNDDDGVRVSFMSKDEKMLYVGEYYHSAIPCFWLRKNHKIESEQGTTHAMMVGFEFDEKEEFGLKKMPAAAYAIPDKVQYAIFYGDNVILSQSFLYVPSTITVCEPVPSGTFKIMNKEVPLYTLRTVKSDKVVPMSEGIAIYKNRIYISSELYNSVIPKLGELWDAGWCYSIPLSVPE